MLCGSTSLTRWTFGVWEDVWEDFRARTLFAGWSAGPASRTALSVRPLPPAVRPVQSSQCTDSHPNICKPWLQFPQKKALAWAQWSGQKRSVDRSRRFACQMMCGSTSLTLWTFDVWEDVWEDFRARTLLAGRPSGPASRTALSVRLSYQLFDS